MRDPLKKILQPITELQTIRGIELPVGLEFLQLIITGPPGAGKSHYIEKIGGWPNEGYLDLSQRGWWRDPSLLYRPREVHLGLPFKGIAEAVSVFDKQYLSCDLPPPIAWERLSLPPRTGGLFRTNWRDKYIFEFLIPSPSTIYEQRSARGKEGYFPVDENLNLEMVRRQVAVYREVALYLHRAGLNVYIRKSLDKPPLHIAEKGLPTVPRWTLKTKSRRSGLSAYDLWNSFRRRPARTEWLDLKNGPIELRGSGRIAHDGRSFQLNIGGTHLRFQPELPIGVDKKKIQKNWIVNTELGCTSRQVQGFLRIKTGETIVLGRENKEYSKLFDFGESIAKRHFSVTNHNGDLIISQISTEEPVTILRLDDRDHREQLERNRHRALIDIAAIYGTNQIAPLPPEDAYNTLCEAIEIFRAEPYREKNDQGFIGGLIEIQSPATPVIIGDLHGKVDNLLTILSENCLLTCLKMKTAYLVVLGDAVHSENSAEMEEFESSICIMDLLLRLKLRFPGNVFYLRGNHDSFSPEINKNGVLQGVLFKEALLERRGPQYVEAMQTLYDLLPYILCSDSFIACHAGPPRSAVTREALVNIAANPRLAKELTTNRLYRSNNLAGYSKSDVKRLRKALDRGPKTRFFVGHTPMDPFGSFWLHAGGIKNHHVIYSAHDDGPSMFIQNDKNFMPLSYPAEPLAEIISNMQQ